MSAHGSGSNRFNADGSTAHFSSPFRLVVGARTFKMYANARPMFVGPFFRGRAEHNSDLLRASACEIYWLMRVCECACASQLATSTAFVASALGEVAASNRKRTARTVMNACVHKYNEHA